MPTALSVVLDVVLRGTSVFGAPYAASLLFSAALWTLPLAIASRVGRVGSALVGVWLAAMAAFSYPGQALYHRVFHTYVARDTVLLGVSFRTIVVEWFRQLGWWSVVAIAVTGVALALAFVRLGRSAGRVPIVAPALALAIAAGALFFDFVETRGDQLALPDVCFAHGVMHALRERKARSVASMRTPAPLPKIPAREHRPNVLLVVTESVRADAICSDPAPACKARFLDDGAADRIPLGKLTTQVPGTVSACVLLWTGLSPDADFATVHAAPTLWEIARAVGYRTAYISAQNLKDADFGAFLDRAGIDVRVNGTELGGVDSILTGAHDETAMARTLTFARETNAPWLAVMHLSNTHTPYRTDPQLEPYEPHTSLPIGGWTAVHNHYRNSVLLQERSFASFMRDLRAAPRWDETIVVFLSDHGEQFGEHGGLYHLHNLFDEELRIPGFVVAGEHAITSAQRAAIATYEGHRTYTEDVNATVRDLLGAFDVALPFASKTNGRSLLRPRPSEEPRVVVAMTTAVWKSDAEWHGTMQGESLVLDIPGKGRQCFDLVHDPKEKSPTRCE